MDNPWAVAGPIDQDGFLAQRTTEAGRLIALVPLTYGRARVTASDPGERGTWRDGY
jgi:hypothetical protein